MKEEIGYNKGEIIIYQSEDGKIRLDVRSEERIPRGQETGILMEEVT